MKSNRNATGLVWMYMRKCWRFSGKAWISREKSIHLLTFIFFLRRHMACVLYFLFSEDMESIFIHASTCLLRIYFISCNASGMWMDLWLPDYPKQLIMDICFGPDLWTGFGLYLDGSIFEYSSNIFDGSIFEYSIE